MPKIKLHRCKYTWVKLKADACWRLEKALKQEGVEYEVVKYGKPLSQRDGVEKLSGQRLVPVIEFEDGSVYREETDDMVATVRAGKLFDKAKAGASATT